MSPWFVDVRRNVRTATCKNGGIVVSEENEKPELIIVRQQDGEKEEEALRGSVEEPAKVMRIGTMIKQLLEEVRQAPLDERSRSRLREIYETSVKELGEGLSADLREELDRLVSPFTDGEVPTDAELRIAHAQLVGWLEGLFHGIQAALFAQQAAAQAQLQELHRRGLPSGAMPQGSSEEEDDGESRPGTYL